MLGYFLHRGGHARSGLVCIAVYGVLGFGGLDHYVVAPVSAHTLTMNLTIALEAVTAAVLLFAVARAAIARAGHKH